MSKQYGGGFSTNGSGAGSAGDQYGFDPIRGAPLSAAFKVRSKRAYRQRGAGLGDGTGAGAGVGAGDPSGFDTIHAGSSVSGIVLSDAAAYKIIPQGVTEQGMSFQKMTSSFHRSRKARKQRGGSQPTTRQRGGALTPAPYDSLGEVLPSSMTGPMTTTGSGGSATGVLDSMLVQTNGLVRQYGGGSRRKHSKTKGKKQSRKQQQRNRQQQQQRNRNRQNQQRNRNRQNQQRTRRRQRGGALGFGPATGPSVILSPQELTKAGLNPQWFNENQVNPNFGGALTVPGGR